MGHAAVSRRRGGSVSECPRPRLDTNECRVEGVVEELNVVKDRGVRWKECETSGRIRRDFQPELHWAEIVRLTRQGLAAYLEVVDRSRFRPKYDPPPEPGGAAHLSQARQRSTRVGGDHGRKLGKEGGCGHGS